MALRRKRNWRATRTRENDSMCRFPSGSIIEVNEQKEIGASCRASRVLVVSLLETGSILRDVLPETVDAALWPVDRANDRRKILFSFLSPYFFLLLLLLFSFSFFFGISRSFASSRKCARVELEARVSWRARIGIYLLSVRYVVRLVNSVSILDRVPKNFPRGPSNPQ